MPRYATFTAAGQPESIIIAETSPGADWHLVTPCCATAPVPAGHARVCHGGSAYDLPLSGPADWPAIRVCRNVLLAATDWRAIRAAETGQPLAQSWADYRAALRDLPQTYAGDPTALVWPTPPAD